MRVLVVSDAPDTCARACGSLRVPVLADRAVDGGEALALLRSAIDAGNPFDMLWVSLGLRDMDGFFFAKCARTTESAVGAGIRTPIWILTSTDSGRQVASAMSGQVDGHLHLPDGALTEHPTPYATSVSSHCA